MKNQVKSSISTRDIKKLIEPTGNLYESIVVVSKRSKQLSSEMKAEMHEKLARFADKEDNLEEVFENREQIEMSRNFERLPKPSTLALEEFLAGETAFVRKSELEEDEL